MFEKMSFLREHRDDVRLRMLREPRGYPAANCNLVLPSSHPEADAGYVIMEQVEYPGMSGTNTICVVTVLLETGMLPMTEPTTELTLEAPAGLIRVTADCADGKVTGVTFRNVPAFATHLDVPGRSSLARDRRRRRRVWRDVLRDRGRRALRAQAHARRGRRHRPHHRDDQGRRRRAAARGPSRTSRASPVSRSASCPGRPTTRRTACGTSSLSRPARSIGNGRRRGPAPSTGRRAGRGRRPGWRRSTHAGALASAMRSATRASSGRSSPAAVVEETAVGAYRGDRPDHHRPGVDHRVSPGTSWTRPTRSPRVHDRRHLGVGGRGARGGARAAIRRPPPTEPQPDLDPGPSRLSPEQRHADGRRAGAQQQRAGDAQNADLDEAAREEWGEQPSRPSERVPATHRARPFRERRLLADDARRSRPRSMNR